MATSKKATKHPTKAASKGAKTASRAKAGRNLKKQSTALAKSAKKTPAKAAKKLLAKQVGLKKAGARKAAATTARSTKVIARKSVTEEIVIEQSAGTGKPKRLLKRSARRLLADLRGGTKLWDATNIADFEPDAPTESGTDDGGYGIKSEDDT
jgi:hypothetical protein